MYQGKVYRTDGGDRIVIAEGGAIEVEALESLTELSAASADYTKAEIDGIIDTVNALVAALQGYIPGEE